MEKLIITNCAADTSMHEGVPATLGDSNVLATEVAKGHAAGAAIAHIHAPPTDYDAWANHTKAIRDKCDVMIQYGISTQNVEQRKAVIGNRPEMISVALCAHNLCFIGRDLMMTHSREELAELMRMCDDNGVKPEFEVFGLGELWMLNDLADKGLVKPPFLLTIFFGRPGGSWTPATAQEFIHRTNELPEGSFYVTSVTGPSHLLLESMAVMSGGHVRVGSEDEPYLSPGVVGDNEAHVARIARIAGEFGRGIASPAEARATLKIPS
ncbi:MAG: 3-keto-5-aminohexanoate cleavage protein [Rhizobiales bacterium]|nr:3-keto-5-aminohexanoate cleavage protein [Hyphomicrobiales bacterium]